MARSYRLHPTTLPSHPPSSHSEPLRPISLKASHQLDHPRPSNDSYLHPPPPPPHLHIHLQPSKPISQPPRSTAALPSPRTLPLLYPRSALSFLYPRTRYLDNRPDPTRPSCIPYLAITLEDFQVGGELVRFGGWDLQETWILATRLWRLGSRTLLLALRMLVGTREGVDFWYVLTYGILCFEGLTFAGNSFLLSRRRARLLTLSLCLSPPLPSAPPPPAYLVFRGSSSSASAHWSWLTSLRLQENEARRLYIVVSAAGWRWIL